MDGKLALVNCLAILNCSHLLNEPLTTHKEMIEKTLGYIKVPEIVSDGDERGALIALRHIITGLFNDISFDKKNITTQFKIQCPFEVATLRAIEEVFQINEKEEEVRSCQLSYLMVVQRFNNSHEVKRLINAANFMVNGDLNNFNLSNFTKDLRDNLLPYESHKNHTQEVDSFVERISLDDEDGLANLFQSTNEALNGCSIKLPWHALNRMMGIMEGAIPGETILMPALPHNGKTTFSFMTTLGIPIFNDANKFDGIPTILDISLENQLSVNMPLAYRILKENLTGQAVNIKSIDPKEAAKYVISAFRDRGWDYVFEKHNSTEFTVDNYNRIIDKLTAKGHKIIASRVDYPGVGNKAGLSNGIIGSEVREMYRRYCNLGKNYGIIQFFPHQLSPAAKALQAMEPTKYVQMLPGKGYTDGCSTIDNEVDCEWYFGRIVVAGRAYLVVCRGKHRTIIETPMSHRHFVLRFNDIGTLPWDMHLETDTSISSVYADAMNEEQDSGFLSNFAGIAA